MNPRETISAQFADWLRTFPLLVHIGTPGRAREVLAPSDEPAFLDTVFRADRAQEAEANLLCHLSMTHIDLVFNAVVAVFHEDLHRFDALVQYYQRFDAMLVGRAQEAASFVELDIAWAACELLAGEPGFFTNLLPWYDRGRWPIGWDGEYPAGQLRVL